MVTIEKRNENFYTKGGLDALVQRIRSLIDLYNNKEFPLQAYVFGFGNLRIEDKKECKGRIKELCDCIGYVVEFRREIKKSTDGQTIEKEVIIDK